MAFSSITFLYYFLPLAAALYYLAPRRAKNASLLLSSLVFYAWGEPKHALLLVLSIVLGCGFGILIGTYREKSWGKAFCALSVSVSLFFLLYFKYADSRRALPVGISFYTFQIISYAVDVYRKEPAQRSLVDLAAYIAMFPQLVAGPIVRYAAIAGQLKARIHSWDLAASGIGRFVIGLSKKVLLANQLGEACSQFQASMEKSVLFYWMNAIAFTLQIYFDFSGYSDMAIGLGRLFGFRLPENFRYPYISASITEFWRRWHISLGSWFRDYVYIPLGGNRKGKKRQLLNILAVWALTGLWHGAAWNFLLWGLYFAALLIAEKFWLLPRLQKSRALSRIYTLFCVMLGFVLFQAESLAQAAANIGGLFGVGGVPLASSEAFYCFKSFALVLLAGIFGATPAARHMARRLFLAPSGSKAAKLAVFLEPLLLALLLAVVTAYLVDGTYNPFLYFRF